MIDHWLLAHLSVVLPVTIALIGFAIYLSADGGKEAETGRLMFFVGLLVALLKGL